MAQARINDAPMRTSGIQFPPMPPAVRMVAVALALLALSQAILAARFVLARARALLTFAWVGFGCLLWLLLRLLVLTS